MKKFFEEFKVTDLLNKIEDEKIEKFIKNLKNYKRKSVLQETTMAYLIHNNPDLEEIDDACKLFDKIDVNRKGKITMDDLYVGLSIIMQTSLTSFCWKPASKIISFKIFLLDILQITSGMLTLLYASIAVKIISISPRDVLSPQMSMSHWVNCLFLPSCGRSARNDSSI